MWEMTNPWWELVLRAVIVYFFVFGLLRVIGKKQIGEFSPFDFVLLLIISEAVSNGLISDEYSVTGALVLAATLVAVNFCVDYLAYKFRKVEQIVEGEPRVIIQNGQILEKVRTSEGITQSELEAALREHGLKSFSDVLLGVLETNGKISIVPVASVPPRPKADDSPRPF